MLGLRILGRNHGSIDAKFLEELLDCRGSVLVGVRVGSPSEFLLKFLLLLLDLLLHLLLFHRALVSGIGFFGLEFPDFADVPQPRREAYALQLEAVAESGLCLEAQLAFAGLADEGSFDILF